MNSIEHDVFEKAYKDFLLKFRKKKEIKFRYYSLQTGGKNHDCAFLGYYTNHGIHGIHYDRTALRYYFGERSIKFNSKPFNLHDGLFIKMPAIFRDAFLQVANNRKGVIIKNNKIIELNTGI